MSKINREQIFVTGHRNPDMDSVCSAWAYARLKNEIDPERYYIPIRGHMNDITRAQFSRLGIDAPMYVQNIRPRIYDVIRKCDQVLDVNDPIYKLCAYFQQKKAPVVPIFDGEKYETLLEVDDITTYFLETMSHTHPLLEFNIDNIGKLLRGRYIQIGEIKEFQTTIALGMMKYEKYEAFMKKLPGPMPVVMLGHRQSHIQLAIQMNCPAIIIVGMGNDEALKADISNYKGTIFVAEDDTDKALQLLKMSVPIKRLLSKSKPPIVRPTDYFDDVKEIIASANFRALPVLNDEGQFYGIIQRSSFLVRPKKKVIMMDHNELNQSIPGLEDAEIFEIIDHHRLAAEKTQKPIFMDIEPLGSTCTLVYGQYRKHDVDIDKETALVLLSGIISDTVILKSPTTTKADRDVATKLTRIAGLKSLKEFGETMFSGGASITTQDARKLICADFKTFEEFGVKFGIGQCEVTQFQGIDEIKDHWMEVLETVKKENGLQWAMIVITNIIREDSIMLSTPFPEKEKLLTYERMSAGQYFCPGVLSRKIQILPEVIRCLSNES
ncbi:inorganic pyrophosphatase/exopolyphosphatase [Tritrichomonas foetus]|uniref:inorganic diphosphatase n=1 Tax=Tritrichomonas foetus TaxID=1144522 RepID=A0A1J4KG70_9EUKA|nr:inorganic pyrophosphatase/exopolyphosphatase [Tritrichomonas foetus]|eukprot:OHT08349.1 inorganic pyrophosphatase/exopolyphosphatase [Tritrichomonas foetus]